MTAVTFETVAWLRRAEVLVTGVLCASVAGCGVAIVQADRRSPRHEAWRDPVSWFASDEAPDAARLRVGLFMVATSLLGLAVVGAARKRPMAPVGVALIAGGLVAGVATAPLDCSIRLEYCEKLVDAGFASDAHRGHVVLSAALTLLAVAVGVLAARRRRSAGSLVAALAITAATAAMFAVPTSELLGSLQALVLAGGTWATVQLWRAAPSLVSPP